MPAASGTSRTSPAPGSGSGSSSTDIRRGPCHTSARMGRLVPRGADPIRARCGGPSCAPRGTAPTLLAMPDTAHLLAFTLAALTLAAIPGPGMLYVLARSLGGGRDVGLRSSLGTALGGCVHVVAAAAGISALVAASATGFTVVKLGVRTLMSATAPPPTVGVSADTDARAFRQGVLTEALNPKTALFFVTF